MKTTSAIALPDYSVTMSVYGKEQPDFLRLSIKSIVEQSHRTNDFIIVCDGELTDGLNNVLDDAQREYPDTVRVIRTKKHVGTAASANMALKLCKNEYIGKMDSDDIALPHRFEMQLRRMMLHPELDIIGGYIEEFDSDSGNAISVRKVPLSNDAVHRFAKRRNPFNNPTLLFKKSAALASGGYSEDLARCEDYDFVVKMLADGAVGGNIPQVVLKYRITEENYRRRRNFANTKAFIAVRWRIYRSGYSSLLDFLIPCAAQLALFLLPSSLTGHIYRKAIR